MKNLLLFPLFLFLFVNSMNAQDQCVPDSMFRDSMVGVYPPPLNDMNPDGGIDESACINAPFLYTLTIKVPTTLIFNGVPIGVDSIVASTEGAISGLPEGLRYTCNPPNCVFDPLVDSLGCLLLRGTATDVNTPGDYELTLMVDIFNDSPFNPLMLTFPNTFFEGADGQYILTLEPEGSTNCLVGTNDLFAEKFSIQQSPNPFSYFTTLNIESESTEDLSFDVYDLLGKRVYQETVRIYEGSNSIEFDGSSLEEGIFIYTLGNKEGLVSGKMTISR